jgi:ABC-type multidrug transport system ATPase subunit
MKTILYSMDGCVKEGEMLLVLGKPGSGATTMLKTIAGETRGYASISGGIPLVRTSVTCRYTLQWDPSENHA